jgi:hypothetical protein
MAISTLNAIYESRKILLVITEHFLTRDWPLLKIVIDNTIKHRPENVLIAIDVLESSSISPFHSENTKVSIKYLKCHNR